MDKNVSKVLAKLRKMTRYERIVIRDWLNSWYDYEKEQEELHEMMDGEV